MFSRICMIVVKKYVDEREKRKKGVKAGVFLVFFFRRERKKKRGKGWVGLCGVGC